MARTPNRDEIEKKAYELYERRGCEDGHADEDWFAAERELNEQGADDAKSRSRIKTAVSQAMQQRSQSARSTRN
jgi:hypothetical protein